MKKLYASLALVAAGTMAVSAFQLPTNQQFNDIKANNRIYSVSDVKVPNHTIFANGVQNRANRADDNVLGDYITFGADAFSGLDANGTVTLEMQGDALALPGIAGWSHDVNFVETIKFMSDPMGEFDADGNLVIKGGTVLGTYTPSAGTTYDVVIIRLVGEDGVDKNDNVLTKQADGSFKMEDGIGACAAFLTETGWRCFNGAMMNMMLAKPNCTYKYHWIAGNGNDNGDYEVPGFIGFEESEWGTSMSMSAILYDLTGDGNPASYEVEAIDGGFSAIADSPICVYNPDDELVDGGDIVYGLQVKDQKIYFSDVTWLLNSDKSQIFLLPSATSASLGEVEIEGLYIHNEQYTFGKLTNMSIDLTNAGVEEILGNVDANAPVEYFNLQGMKINNPAAGQIVIRRQGNKTNKMIVR